jgi:hypothetical protein
MLAVVFKIHRIGWQACNPKAIAWQEFFLLGGAQSLFY